MIALCPLTLNLIISDLSIAATYQNGHLIAVSWVDRYLKFHCIESITSIFIYLVPHSVKYVII